MQCKDPIIIGLLLLLGSVLATWTTGCATSNRYDGLRAVSEQEIRPVAKEYDEGHRPKIGIAFGGGGVRGFMHLGVLRALTEAGIHADIVTGSSAGAIAASLVASGMPYREIEAAAMSVSEFDLADLVLSGRGFINGQALAAWINSITGNRTIQDLPIPLGIAITDLSREKGLLIVEGNVGRAVQASASIPGAFVPVQSKDSIWVDGGLLSLVPVRFTRAMGADVVIGVDIFCASRPGLSDGIIDTAWNAVRLQNCTLSKYETAEADFMIRPDFEPASYGSFRQREQAIAAGYEAGVAFVEKIRSDGRFGELVSHRLRGSSAMHDIQVVSQKAGFRYGPVKRELP